MEKNLKLSIEKYLSICGQIEKTVAAIYGHWSEAPEHDEKVRTLWRVMQDEEEEHFNQIEMLKRMTRGQNFGQRTLSDEHTLKVAAYAKQCLERISTVPLHARVALLIAIQLEDLFKEFHACQAFDCQNAGLTKMFKNLARNDGEHANRLKDAYKSFYATDPPVCKVGYRQFVDSDPATWSTQMLSAGG